LERLLKLGPLAIHKDWSQQVVTPHSPFCTLPLDFLSSPLFLFFKPFLFYYVYLFLSLFHAPYPFQQLECLWGVLPREPSRKLHRQPIFGPVRFILDYPRFGNGAA
jgi:hypothetical protein